MAVKMVALWVILTIKLTGEVSIQPMDMDFNHPADCQYAANYFNSNVYKFPDAATVNPFYYCQVNREGTL